LTYLSALVNDGAGWTVEGLFVIVLNDLGESIAGDGEQSLVGIIADKNTAVLVESNVRGLTTCLAKDLFSGVQTKNIHK
jgi:hypothetical protein